MATLLTAAGLVICATAVSYADSQTETPAGGPSDENPVDSAVITYHSDIRPILSYRCHKCHGETSQKGGLRLDEKQFVEEGGDSGKPILASSPEQSELYRRITSPDAGHRMPLGGDALAAEDVELIKRWIEQGTSWPELVRFEPTDDWKTHALLFIDEYSRPWQKYFGAFSDFLYPALVALVIFIFLERGKQLFHKQHRWTAGRFRPLFAFCTWIHPAWYVVVLLVLAMISMRRHGQFLQYEIVRLEEKIASLQPTGPDSKPGEAPIPPRPKHPKRLGGAYYRGNDERSPNLFNGGFYRTAKLDVTLCDANRKPLAWGDADPARPLLIRLEIQRAKGATPELFTDGIMKSIYLSVQVAGDNLSKINDTPASLEEIEPGESWVSYYSLVETSEPFEAASGMVYVYEGAVNDAGKVHGHYHYGIGYDLTIRDGQISAESELWMGSLYRIGALHFPPPDAVTLSEWFDFREIPEITGNNSTDPELLGIPEHDKLNAGRE